MSVTCPRCKSECWDTDRFCPICGASLDEAGLSAGQSGPDDRDRSWEAPAKDDNAFDFQPLEFAPDDRRRTDGRLSGWAAIAFVLLLVLIIVALVFGTMALLSGGDDDDVSGANTAAIETGAVLVADGAETPRITARADRTIPDSFITGEAISVDSLAEAPAQSMTMLRAAAREPVATPDTSVEPIVGDGTGGVGSDPDATIPLIGPQRPNTDQD